MHRTLIAALVILLGFGLGSTVEAADSVKSLMKDARVAIAGGEFDRAESIVDGLAAIGGEEAIEAIYKIGFAGGGESKKLYDKCLNQLATMEGGLAYCIDEGKKARGSENVFIAEVCSVAADREESARAYLSELLGDKNPIIQGVAVAGLEKSQHGEAVEPLINLLEELDGRKRKDVLYYQVRDALFNLTFQDFDDLADWRNWWATIKTNFDPKKLDAAGKTGVVRKKREDDADFWGVPITSKNVVFVIDTSGSMRYVHKDDIPGLARGDGSDGGGSSGGGRMTPEQDRLAKFWTRMEMAKRELRKVISAVKQDTLFNIVSFDTDTQTFQKRAIVASPGNKKKALKFVDTLRFRDGGNTNTTDALIEAFRADKSTNTIFFLSDGLPSKDGKVNDPTGPILDKVFSLNRFRKIKINTFGFEAKTQAGQPNPGLEAANGFLRQLAESTGGTFTDMKVDNNLKPPTP